MGEGLGRVLIDGECSLATLHSSSPWPCLPAPCQASQQSSKDRTGVMAAEGEVTTGQLPMPQRMTPHPCAARQHWLDSPNRERRPCS